MKKEMLINVLQPEECRIAIVEDGVLEELYIERTSQESYVGNIYKGRIVNIEPSIQAAFVDFGIGRNGFLHVSDVDPAYYKHLLSPEELAAYEAELEREYGRSLPRARGRDQAGPRGATTADTLARPPAERTPAPPDEELIEEFAAGLTDELPSEEDIAEDVEATAGATAAEAVVESEPSTAWHETEDAATEAVEEPSAEEAEFAEGLIDVDEPTTDPAAATGETAAERITEEEEFADGIAPTPPPTATGSLTHAEPSTRDDIGEPTTQPTPSAAPTSTDQPAQAVPLVPTVSAEPGEVTEGETITAGELPAVEPTTEEAEPRKKSRVRRTKAKADDAATSPTAEAAETAGEGKAKPKSRRTRKKAEDDTSDNDGDDKPRVMGGAERRTTADDDEPEIRPFFDDDSGFDPDAPNDRFVNGQETTSMDHAFAADPETAEEAEEEARGVAREWERGRGTDDLEAETAPVPAAGRSLLEREADERPTRERSRGRGGRDRGTRNGERGGRGGEVYRNGHRGGRDRGLPKPPIEQIFKKGQEVIVQVIKEAVGTKGPTLSTYISIAGRYLVLMPSLNRVGVSRKIEDPVARRRLREIMAELNPPKGVGFIVRTAAIDRDARELRNDLAYLLRLWQVVVKRIKRMSSPVEIYRESDMITRTIRDIFTSDIDTIWVDEPNAFAHASEFLQIVMPRFASRIRYFESTEPLFHKYGIEEEIAKIYQKRVDMPLGGSLIIEQTEALVAIDVNSGNFRADNNAEETAFQMNLIAAKEIARQLRLRDLGGVIVSDFIDMKSEVHRRKVEDAFREALRRDRARTKILRISQFGLIEMTRQRIRPSLKRYLFTDCPHCNGNGYVKTAESLSIDTMRLLQLAAHRAPAIASVQVTVPLEVAHYLLNKRRKDLAALEERAKIEIQITGQPGIPPDTLTVRCFDHNGNEVRLLNPPQPRLSGGKIPSGRGNRGNDRRPPVLD